ncbi:hypothetical protein MHYP_G00047130 [Metynnis hypsauchen]
MGYSEHSDMSAPLITGALLETYEDLGQAGRSPLDTIPPFTRITALVWFLFLAFAKLVNGELELGRLGLLSWPSVITTLNNTRSKTKAPSAEEEECGQGESEMKFN